MSTDNRRRVLFLDRDGTIIVEPPVTQQIDSLELLEFIPGVIGALSSIARSREFDLVLVTNQDGLGTPSFPEEDFWPAHNLMMQTLKGEGVVFEDVYIDRTFPHEHAPTRKPGVAMLKKYLAGGYDLASSFVIGDRESDVQLAENLGARAIYFGAQKQQRALLSTESWDEIAKFLLCGRV